MYQKSLTRDDKSGHVWTVWTTGTWITGFCLVKESQLLFEHSLKDQLLDSAVYAGGCDIIDEVAQELKQSTETREKL